MSEKRMVYAEDVIQRIRDLAPEILGGWYNPDIENELEQLVCVVENTPTAAADAQRWRYTAEEPPEGRKRRLLRPRSDRPRRCPLCGRYVLTVRQREPGGGLSLDAASETTVGG